MKKKDFYIAPEAVFFDLENQLSLLNSLSVGGTAEDWDDGEEWDWGDWTNNNF